jgi:hypothetical protein
MEEEILQVGILNINEVVIPRLVEALLLLLMLEIESCRHTPVLDKDVVAHAEVRVDCLHPKMEGWLILVGDAQVLERGVDHPLAAGANQMPIQADIEVLGRDLGAAPPAPNEVQDKRERGEDQKKEIEVHPFKPPV